MMKLPWRRRSECALCLDPGPAVATTIDRVLGPSVDTVPLDHLHNLAFSDHMAGAAFEGDWERVQGRVVVARRNNYWLGYALASRPDDEDYPGWWIIKLIGVRPSEQRSGVGTSVASDMIEWLAGDGATLICASANSEGGQRTLDRLGFSYDPEWGTSLRLSEPGR